MRYLLNSSAASTLPLEAVLRAAPEEVLDAVGSPDVLPLILSAQSGLSSEQDALARALPNLLTRLHQLAVVPPEPLLYRGGVHELVGGQGGPILLNPPGRALLLDGGGLSVELADGSHVEVESLEQGSAWHPIGNSEVVLCTHDTNPNSHIEAHPDKQGNAVDLGGHSLEDWSSSLSEAFEVIEAALPEWSAELPSTLQRLVPVGFQSEMHLSASYREAPGIAYLSLHPSVLTLAEAIVHETQHGKLNLLLWLDPVLSNGHTSWAESPVRPDLRPLIGVLLAVHAFAPVAALHARLAAMGHPLAEGPGFQRRRAEVLSGNEGGLDVLRRQAEATKSGERLLRDLEELHSRTVELGAGLPTAELELPPG